MDEIWKPIEGYINYKVSNKGNVFSIANNKMLKPYSNGNGYYRVTLRNNGKSSNHYVHRLVAQAFLPNPDNLPQVNHKDENKTNNFVFINPDGTVDPTKSNLEWCSSFYNINYGSAISRMKKTKGIPIVQYSLDGEFIKKWDSAAEAAQVLGFNKSNIRSCAKERYGFKSAKGYLWKGYRDPQELLDALEALFEECGDEDK